MNQDLPAGRQVLAFREELSKSDYLKVTRDGNKKIRPNNIKLTTKNPLYV